jgi:hypothetical protein
MGLTVELNNSQLILFHSLCSSSQTCILLSYRLSSDEIGQDGTSTYLPLREGSALSGRWDRFGWSHVYVPSNHLTV